MFYFGPVSLVRYKGKAGKVPVLSHILKVSKYMFFINNFTILTVFYKFVAFSSNLLLFEIFCWQPFFTNLELNLRIVQTKINLIVSNQLVNFS